MAISENIKKYRNEKGLTQKKLGELSGLSEITIRKIESGKGNPRPNTLQDIADVFEITVKELNGEKELIKIGSNIRKIRNEQNMTREKLSSLTGISIKKLKDFETGVAVPEKEDFLHLEKALHLLGISTVIEDWIYNTDFNPKNMNEQNKISLDRGINSLTVFKDSSILNKNLEIILVLVIQLNDQGQEKAIEHLKLLTKIPEYIIP